MKIFRGYRRIVEIVQGLLITGLPFLKIKGLSVLRFDIPTLKLYFFGTVIWMKDFYLVLFLIILFVFLLIFVTTIFGRVWCGWLCPQTVLLDLSDDIARPFSRRYGYYFQKIALVPLTALVSATIIWYFIPPFEMIHLLFHSRLITVFFVVLWVLIYAELTFLGRRFCTTICPYSMLQNGLFDRDTFVIAFQEGSENKCMGCDKCVRVCPVGIDIKKGLRRECIACAECIDACRSMTQPRGIRPFIAYRGRLLRGKTLLLAGINLLVLAIFIYAMYYRPPFDVVVMRDTLQVSNLVNVYRYKLVSNRGVVQKIRITVDKGYRIVGEREVVLGPYTILNGTIMLKKTVEASSKPYLIFSKDGYEIKQKVGYL